MDAFDAITTRYACRAYTDEQLTADQTEMLIKAANAAPAASRDYSVIKLTVVQDAALRAEIEAATAHGLPALGDHPTFQAPTLMILSVLPNERLPMVAYCNASCAAENIMVQATALGLASVFLMGVPLVMRERPALLEKLNIVDGFMPVVVVAVGHAKRPGAAQKPERLRVERF